MTYREAPKSLSRPLRPRRHEGRPWTQYRAVFAATIVACIAPACAAADEPADQSAAVGAAPISPAPSDGADGFEQIARPEWVKGPLIQQSRPYDPLGSNDTRTYAVANLRGVSPLFDSSFELLVRAVATKAAAEGGEADKYRSRLITPSPPRSADTHLVPSLPLWSAFGEGPSTIAAPSVKMSLASVNSIFELRIAGATFHGAPRSKNSRQTLINWSVAFYAPTPDELRDSLKFFFQTYEREVLRPAKEQLTQQREPLAKEQERLEREVNEKNAELATVDKQLATVVAMEPETLTEARSKALLLDVEEAGLNARLKAIDDRLQRILGQNSESPRDGAAPKQRVESTVNGLANIEQLVSLKVTAEIDSATISAQKKVLGDLIAEQALFGRRVELKNMLTHLEGLIRHGAQRIAGIDEALENLVPFEINDNRVTYQKVVETPEERPTQ